MQEARQKLGFKISYYLTNPTKANIEPNAKLGQINKKVIESEISDYSNSTFYISGTHAMVESMQKILKSLGVNSKNIKVDFFSGYS